LPFAAAAAFTTIARGGIRRASPYDIASSGLLGALCAAEI
jgi:hypothetical protein